MKGIIEIIIGVVINIFWVDVFREPSLLVAFMGALIIICGFRDLIGLDKHE